MSLIGSLEKLNLSDILQRVEAHAKTGLLKVQQAEQWVELYFRRGQLMCIGPVYSHVTLGDRLLQAGVISQSALQEAAFTIDTSQLSETRMALTLIDLGHVSSESLRTWAAAEASQVIQILLTWSSGEIYFEEEEQPPAERLLVSLSVSTLLPVSSPQPVAVTTTSTASQEQSDPMQQSPDAPDISDAPTLLVTSQFFAETLPVSNTVPTFSWPESPMTDLGRNTDSLSPSTAPLTPPQPVTAPIRPIYVDTSYMHPHMVMIPTDLSAQREQNPHVQLTQEQWQLFTRADGQTSLRMACQTLAMAPELICRVAGELVALGLVTIAMPFSMAVNELSPVSRDFIQAGLGNGYLAPGHAATVAQPWAVTMPVTDESSHFSSTAPIETDSQWGNGGNGATFLLRGGWVLAPPSSIPSQPLQSSGPLQLHNRVYAQAGGSR